VTANQIRTKFLNFFKSKGHAVIASDSVVPKEDATVLFTTAGMQQFKRQFLGHIDGYTRATTSQKCLRTDDLDEVGKTDFHHTFFEMLGNFSFGDYFKKEAIAWAWEFLTRELKIPAEKLWVSVYKEDSEAKEIWLKDIQIPADRLVELGDHSNFWPADAKENGPNGPCGPCSEIFYDYGVNSACTNTDCNPDCDCGRFCEVWNLVFTQFNRQEGGVLDPLPSKNIDTGMGLERLVSVLQGKRNNFETDIFAPILKSIETHIEQGKYALALRDKRVMADHIRAVVFSINDGVVPSNEGRGYVVKKLIIDSTDIALQAGLSAPAVYQLGASIGEAMGEPYPEILDKIEDIAGIIRKVEESYIKVRQERVPELQAKVQDLKQNKSEKEFIDGLGNLIFIFKDTYGLTVPTIEMTIKVMDIDEKALKDALTKFEALMKRQQDQSRAGSKMMGDVFTDIALHDIDLPKTRFFGYEEMACQAKVLRMFVDNEVVESVEKGQAVQLILDQTPLYAESGGQVGDAGWIAAETGKVEINDTQKRDDIYIHRGVVKDGTVKGGDAVDVKVDHERRLAIMRHHTATHILQVALREVLGAHVKQQGSLVDQDRLRFDFTHHKALTHEEILKIEDFVNKGVLQCEPVTKEVMSIKEAQTSGALAFFAEKYGDTVRVVSVGEYSKEFCGGTHLDSTGQIGLFKIVGESAIAQGIRRIEAKAGYSALEYVKVEEYQLMQVAKALKAPVTELVERVKTQTQRMKQMEKDIENSRFAAIKGSVEEILAQAVLLGETKIITRTFKDLDMGTLRKVADLLKNKADSFILVLGAYTGDNASILVVVSDDMIDKGVKANDLIKEVAPLINGSGGGRSQMAQAGSKEVGKVVPAVEKAKKIIQEILTANV